MLAPRVHNSACSHHALSGPIFVPVCRAMQLTVSVKLKGTFCLWSLAAVLLMALLYLNIKETLAKDSMHCICGRACSLGLRQRYVPTLLARPSACYRAAVSAPACHNHSCLQPAFVRLEVSTLSL